jgi:excisionase family DNA binding protein
MPHAAVQATALVPDEAERQEAEQASRALAALAGRDRVHVEAEAEGMPRQSFILPAAAVRLLTDVLVHLSQGQGVAVLPENAELTTQQAADMLNVSRPYFVGLLEAGVVPFHKAGTHRRVRLRDLVSYKEKRQAASRAAMDELTAQAQELGLGY